jgi:hypothetical protein
VECEPRVPRITGRADQDRADLRRLPALLGSGGAEDAPPEADREDDTDTDVTVTMASGSTTTGSASFSGFLTLLRLKAYLP